MNKRKVIIVCALSIFSGIELFCQFYNTGTESFLVKWMEIKTPEATIIFPENNYKTANNFANYLHSISDSTLSGLNSARKKPVRVVLYNRSVLSNGYVVWSPRRMEIITTPPQETYPELWTKQLALHEYRHVCQLEKLNNGFTKGLTFLTGEMATGGVSAFVPLWFLEGDAVYNETKLSDMGRGREPSFFQEIKAVEMENNRRYSYDQAYLGTYRTLLPNHYNYGYPMVAWATKKFGKEFWPDVLESTGKYPFLIAPFYFGMKKQGSLSKVKLYDSTMNYLKNSWKSKFSNQTYAEYNPVKSEYKSDYINYKFPFQLNDNVIYSFRTSLDQSCNLVRITNGKEYVVYNVGQFLGSQPAYSDKFIAWEEIQYDLRWEQKSFSNIRIFSINKANSFLLKANERHFSPAIDPAGKKIAVLKIDPANNYCVEVYDIESKSLVEKIDAGDTIQLSFLTWTSNSSLATVLIGSNGNCLGNIDLKSKLISQLSETTKSTISSISCAGKRLFFTGVFDGQQNIYSFDLADSSITRITNSVFGANYSHYYQAKNQLLFSEYSSKGYRIKSLDKNKFDTLRVREFHGALDLFKISIPDKGVINKSDSVFVAKPYNKLLHSINFHSRLVPIYFDVQEVMQRPASVVEAKPGFNLLSQNVLSTVTSSFGYYYSNGNHHVVPAISIRAFYPVISVKLDYGGPPVVIWNTDSNHIRPKQLKTFYSIESKLSVPLNFSSSRITARLIPSIRYYYINSYIATDDKQEGAEFEFDQNSVLFYKGFFVTYFDIDFSLNTKMAYRNLFPRWGIHAYISRNERSKSFPDETYFESTVATATIYTPGFLPNHSLIIKPGIEIGKANRLSLPRGYNPGEFTNFLVGERLTTEYCFPLVYPDLSIGPLVYIKRIHVNTFYDFMLFDKQITKYYSNTHYQWLASAGFTLGLEVNLLRFYFPMIPELTYVFGLNDSKSHINFNLVTRYGFSLTDSFNARVKP